MAETILYPTDSRWYFSSYPNSGNLDVVVSGNWTLKLMATSQSGQKGAPLISLTNISGTTSRIFISSSSDLCMSSQNIRMSSQNLSMKVASGLSIKHPSGSLDLKGEGFYISTMTKVSGQLTFASENSFQWNTNDGISASGSYAHASIGLWRGTDPGVNHLPGVSGAMGWIRVAVDSMWGFVPVFSANRVCGAASDMVSALSDPVYPRG